jgi:hypothetical protein
MANLLDQGVLSLGAICNLRLSAASERFWVRPSGAKIENQRCHISEVYVWITPASEMGAFGESQEPPSFIQSVLLE